MEHTDGLVNHLKNQNGNSEQKESEITSEGLLEMIKLVSNGRPTKEKPFTFIKGHCYYDGCDIGAHSFKNDGEHIYIQRHGQDIKIDHEELFKSGNIKFV